MTIQSHLSSLSEKRELLKARISEEMSRPQPNFELISELKKQNLRLKEEVKHCLEQLDHQEAS